MSYPFLIGERIYLSPVGIEDAEFLCKGENDPAVRNSIFLALPIELSIEKDKIQKYLASNESIVFTIFERDSDNPVGQTAFFRVDYVSRAAIFYLAILDPSYWSKGYGTEATQIMVDYSFNTLNLNRIQLHVWAENFPAIKIYQKFGFIKEGVLRQAMYHKGTYCDFWVMGILRQDWLKKQKQKL